MTEDKVGMDCRHRAMTLCDPSPLGSTGTLGEEGAGTGHEGDADGEQTEHLSSLSLSYYYTILDT